MLNFYELQTKTKNFNNKIHGGATSMHLKKGIVRISETIPNTHNFNQVTSLRQLKNTRIRFGSNCTEIFKKLSRYPYPLKTYKQIKTASIKKIKQYTYANWSWLAAWHWFVSLFSEDDESEEDEEASKKTCRSCFRRLKDDPELADVVCKKPFTGRREIVDFVDSCKELSHEVKNFAASQIPKYETITDFLINAGLTRTEFHAKARSVFNMWDKAHLDVLELLITREEKKFPNQLVGVQEYLFKFFHLLCNLIEDMCMTLAAALDPLFSIVPLVPWICCLYLCFFLFLKLPLSKFNEFAAWNLPIRPRPTKVIIPLFLPEGIRVQELQKLIGYRIVNSPLREKINITFCDLEPNQPFPFWCTKLLYFEYALVDGIDPCRRRVRLYVRLNIVTGRCFYTIFEDYGDESTYLLILPILSFLPALVFSYAYWIAWGVALQCALLSIPCVWLILFIFPLRFAKWIPLVIPKSEVNKKNFKNRRKET